MGPVSIAGDVRFIACSATAGTSGAFDRRSLAYSVGERRRPQPVSGSVRSRGEESRGRRASTPIDTFQPVSDSRDRPDEILIGPNRNPDAPTSPHVSRQPDSIEYQQVRELKSSGHLTARGSRTTITRDCGSCRPTDSKPEASFPRNRRPRSVHLTPDGRSIVYTTLRSGKTKADTWTLSVTDRHRPTLVATPRHGGRR